MKLRILDDSIRLRLERDEVDRLFRGEGVACATRFPDGPTFTYRLIAQHTTAAGFADGTLTVAIDADRLRRWASDDAEVSIEETLALGRGGHSLSVLIEKDFECLAPRAGESQTNRFPNPKLRRD